MRMAVTRTFTRLMAAVKSQVMLFDGGSDGRRMILPIASFKKDLPELCLRARP